MSETGITGGEAVYRVLRGAGVETVFGLLGGSMLELYDAIHRNGGIAYIGARDERAAGHMADAYARITGGPGVVLGAQAGPGVVNLATAVAEAHLAYSPLVAIAGAISRTDLGKDTFQEIDQVALFAPISKRSILVADPARLPAMLTDAIRLAMSGRRGPVVLHVPRDLFAAGMPEPEAGPIRIARAGPPRSEELAAVAALLAEARRPVIVAGGGLKSPDGRAALVALAERLRIPVVASTGHADLMPHGHALFAGQGGPRGNAVASGLTREADAIVAIGARLAFNSTFLSHDYIAADARIAQIDIEPSAVGRYFPAEIAIQADAVESARAIAGLALPGGEGWADWRDGFSAAMQKLRAERAAEAENSTAPMHPHRALAEIRAALPEDAIVALDTGNACLQAADRLAHYETPGLIAPLDFGLVGFAYAAALGARAAAPGRPVVAVLGDGAFGYAMAEVMTAVQYGLAVTAVVLDNGAWGAEKAYQREFFGGRLLGAEIDGLPFGDYARLCGARGWRADGPDALRAALAEALAGDAPAVIHAGIDPDALIPLRKDLFAGKT